MKNDNTGRFSINKPEVFIYALKAESYTAVYTLSVAAIYTTTEEGENNNKESPIDKLVILD